MLMADAQARKLILVRLSERVAIVAPGGLDALLVNLRRLGHTPTVKEA